MGKLLLGTCVVLLLPASITAQVPVFSPPKERPVEVPQEPPKPATPQESGADRTKAAAPTDELAPLFQKLRRWPSPRAREAAYLLAGLGAKARHRLVEGLQDKDWRVQSGCAFALAEMGEKEAIAPLIAAVQDPSNRASLPDLMKAIVRLDLAQGVSVVLPFVGHASGRVRAAAMEALPATLGAELVPDLITLFRSPRPAVRATALELLARIPGEEARPEFFDALGDPEPQVAMRAARQLARSRAPEVRDRLLELARSAPMRPATYAMLALVEEEDLHGEPLVPDDGEIRRRAQAFLAGDDPFYTGAAAILLANVSFRSEDPVLRQLADRYLVPALIGTVAGGVFFSDYIALEELCWRKLELLTGKPFGQEAALWKRWWRDVEGKFVARRELRSLGAEQLAQARILLVRGAPDGSVSQVLLSGGEGEPAFVDAATPLLLGPGDRERLLAAFEACRFFDTRGDPEDSRRLEPFTQVVLELPASSLRYQRLHYGPVPGGIRPLVALIEQLGEELAWQRLVVGGSAAERVEALRAARAELDRAADAAERAARVAALAVASYPKLRLVDRRLAVAAIAAAPAGWREANHPALVGLLDHERTLTEPAAELVGLLSEKADPKLRETVLGLVEREPSLRGDDVLRRYLEQQPLAGVVALMTDARPRVRALAAEALARFRDDREVVSLLIGGLNDYEPRVREACIKSLAAMDDERILAMLETVLQGEDEALRIRAIHALGTIGGEQLTPRLMELYREGDGHVRWAVVRALRNAGGRRAIIALTGIARDTGELEIRREALEALVSLGGTDVAEELAGILQRVPETEIKMIAMSGLAQVSGARAIPAIRAFTTSEVPELRRSAILTLARLGDREMAPALAGLIEASLQGDAAAEAALEELTFHCPADPSPARRLTEHKLWLERHAGRERLEWFVMAAAAAGVPLDEETDWLDAAALEEPELRALVSLLATPNRALRLEADRRLRALLGLDLAPLSPLATPEEIALQAERFRNALDR